MLNVLDTLFTLTEVLKFAGRLAYREVLSPTGLVRIELHGMQGRVLTSERDWWMPRRRYVGQSDLIAWETTDASPRLMSSSDTLARGAATRVFAAFGYTSVPNDLLADWQRRLHERRL
ncbi:MAG: hypothetical protein ACKVP6_13435 [Mycobacterium sp.]